MLPKAATHVLTATVLVTLLPFALPLRAQEAGATLSGTVTGPSGRAVANANLSVKNLATGQTTETQTNSSGVYSLANLAPGDYEVSVTAEGFSTQVAKATLAAGVKQKVDLTLVALPEPAGGLSLQDLGFSPTLAKGSPEEQARLDRRTHMLKIHQELGLITTGPLVATVITSLGAHGRRSTVSGRNLHAALGWSTAGLYFTTASFAIFAPKISETKMRGPIRVHKALAWVHGTGMILTPILGEIAFAQRSRGERVHGIASAHGAVAVVTAAAYGAAIISVSVKF